MGGGWGKGGGVINRSSTYSTFIMVLFNYIFNSSDLWILASVIVVCDDNENWRYEKTANMCFSVTARRRRISYHMHVQFQLIRLHVYHTIYILYRTQAAIILNIDELTPKFRKLHGS